MKVLHVIQTLSGRFGGPVVSLKALARNQVDEGHQVTICTTNSDYPKGTLRVKTNTSEIENGVAVWYHPVQFKPLLYSKQLRKWINANIKKFDIVHIHGLYRFPVTYAAWVARKERVPYVVTPHGALDPFIYRQSKHSVLLKRLYEKMFDIPNLNGASAINYATQEELERARFLGLDAPSAMVSHGIDWGLYEELPPKGSFRARLGIESDTPLVLFLGRINFKKGIDLLIPAFSKVAKFLPGTRLAIVGPDNDNLGLKVRHWCKDLGIDHMVVMVDHINPDQVRQAYVDANLFVLPSYSENFGMAVVESMACGCPVVISDQVNIHDEVKKYGVGIVVKLDSDEIAKAIHSILTCKTAAREMGDAGRRLAKTRFDYEVIVAKVNRMYGAAIQFSSNNNIEIFP